MTSKNSFWANCRENHKRRIWVWIVAALSWLLIYGGMTMVYLSRIRSFYAAGTYYRTKQAFQEALYQAARDALGFSDNVFPLVIFLGAVIGMQGFSYLYDRKKVDLYHSVPVAKDRRFAVIYGNGLVIYLVSNLAGLLVGMALAGAQGAVNAAVISDAGLAFLWNLLLFLVSYHMMILSVMLTGNRFVTICVFLLLGLFEICINEINQSLSRSFYETYTTAFIGSEPKLSALYDCTAKIWQLKNLQETGERAKLAFPIMGKWMLLAAAFLALAWIAYRKRASEVAGRAIAFPLLKPFVKAAVAIPGAMVIGGMVYNASNNSETLLALGMLAGALLLCAAAEVIYAFDIRCILKHPASTGIVLAAVLAIFCIYKWDLIGYDSYIPDQNKVESIAILPDGYYDNYWDENGQYMDPSAYIKENMFLTDTEPVLALAGMQPQTKAGDMDRSRVLHVLYRLRSGKEKVRRVTVDYEDPKTAALLNRIFKTEEFKYGFFQVMADETYCDGVTKISYTNGPVKATVSPEEAYALRAAWIKDMEQFDFQLARDGMPCGQITLEYADHSPRQWYVYDVFSETIACLKKNEAFYPAKPDAEDIDYITVTNYHNEMSQEDMQTADTRIWAEATAVNTRTGTYTDYSVKETFTDKEQIEQILSAVHCSYLTSPWGSNNGIEENYSVDVVFRKDSAYPYDRDAYYFNYVFARGQVPDFVTEATMYAGETE